MGREHEVIRSMEGRVERFAGETMRKRVMESSKKISAKTGKKEIAKWVKGTMERLDALVDENEISNLTTATLEPITVTSSSPVYAGR